MYRYINVKKKGIKFETHKKFSLNKFETIKFKGKKSNCKKGVTVAGIDWTAKL